MPERATIQEILNRFLVADGLDYRRRKVCGNLQACRTERLGGLQLRCDQCDTEQRWYHSCRDRHCPQCQNRATQAWCERQHSQMLPVTYYHLVFTLPHELNGWVQLHPREIHRLLFQSVWSTLSAFGRDPKRLGGELGMTAVLHTWGQTLTQHVHLHCLVPGGALRKDGEWAPSKGNYLFPVRALSVRFRGYMVAALRQAIDRGELSRVTHPGEVDRVLDDLMQVSWNVYTKACLNHGGTVVDYLGRYTHRIAITNRRILGVDDDEVRFTYKDYRTEQRKVMTLTGQEFVRRFLQHILPKGLMRVRHYGFLANRCRRRKLDLIRVALKAPVPRAPAVPPAADPPHYPCPKCRAGQLHVVAEIPKAVSPFPFQERRC
ncbi:IS91 family transposase [Ectothiorhodospira variabilis]|uniref:IS91 family transposase n=1 Tax=Ectothiorhodospira variabilis TaxID=505694 RepID=UPI001EFB2E6D|nr:IS91 family transposase [Ectothiorhodospira variabilis]MCG5496032.1 IS91 family transposase [Ectothiorhodospira variabilis]MCG5505400.1 IS91 family transposase [Ectothiorhodospira variabilis]MCG5508586.1 IS91 family transposase [Ectothiorhodospira variabilis]